MVGEGARQRDRPRGERGAAREEIGDVGVVEDVQEARQRRGDSHRRGYESVSASQRYRYVAGGQSMLDGRDLQCVGVGHRTLWGVTPRGHTPWGVSLTPCTVLNCSPKRVTRQQ